MSDLVKIDFCAIRQLIEDNLKDPSLFNRFKDRHLALLKVIRLHTLCSLADAKQILKILAENTDVLDYHQEIKIFVLSSGWK
jgi:hypothetical protein